MPALPPLVTSYHPATFTERGVAGPFTGALLAGARLRRVPGVLAQRSILEAIVSNPSGGRGIYIVPWAEVRQSFRPTIHDIQLGQAVLSSLQAGAALSPAAIRKIGRDVARAGFAGREVARAASVAATREESQAGALAAFLLQQLGRNLSLGMPAGTDGRLLLAAASARLGRPEATLASAIHRAAELCAHCGIGPDTQDAYVPSLVSAMRNLIVDVPATIQQQPSLGGVAVDALVTAARTTIKLTEISLSITLARAKRLPELICGLVDTPDIHIALFEQTAWLLDGWQRICMLWHAAETSQEKAAAIVECLNFIPDLPDEAEAWCGLPPRTAAQGSGPRKPAALRMRSEPVLDIVARNEQLRAMAA